MPWLRAHYSKREHETDQQDQRNGPHSTRVNHLLPATLRRFRPRLFLRLALRRCFQRCRVPHPCRLLLATGWERTLYPPVPPTVSRSTFSVGIPTPTGTDCPSLPQVPTPCLLYTSPSPRDRTRSR